MAWRNLRFFSLGCGYLTLTRWMKQASWVFIPLKTQGWCLANSPKQNNSNNSCFNPKHLWKFIAHFQSPANSYFLWEWVPQQFQSWPCESTPKGAIWNLTFFFWFTLPETNSRQFTPLKTGLFRKFSGKETYLIFQLVKFQGRCHVSFRVSGVSKVPPHGLEKFCFRHPGCLSSPDLF